MRKIISGLSILFLSLFMISFIILLRGKNDIWETLCITFGVTSYHFGMRLSVGAIIEKILHNNVDYAKRWFVEKPFEKSLYAAINVKKWKKYMPTYDADNFDIKKHSIIEIVKASCQAEIVHEVIMIFSFLPIILMIWFQSGEVFVITSILAALLDGIFVIVQRYNRPRLLRLAKKITTGFSESEHYEI